MRLTLVGDHPPPYGGISIHVQQLHRFLVKQGVEVRVLDIGKGRVPKPGVLPVGSWREYAWLLPKLAGSPDVLHAHVSGNNPKAWAVAASLSAGRGPRILTVHSGLFPGFAAQSARHRLLVKGATALFDRVIAVSGAVKASLLGCGVPEIKVRQLPAFLASQVIPGQIPAGFDEIRRRRSPLILYAHHPSPVYGRAVAFEAVKRLSSTHAELGLLVVGPGTRAAEFERDAKRLGVAAFIENLGELPHAEVLAALARSDAFIRPTTADGDALSVREALTLGVPTIASDASVRPEGVVVFPQGNAEALAEAVRSSLAAKPAAPLSDCGPPLLSLYRELFQQKQGGTRASSR